MVCAVGVPLKPLMQATKVHEVCIHPAIGAPLPGPGSLAARLSQL